MAVIDIVVVALAVGALVWHHRSGAYELRSRGSALVGLGLGVVGLFYLADLFIMLLLPVVAPSIDAASVMTFLHLNVSWISIPAAGGLVFAGFILVGRQQAALLQIAQEKTRELTASEAIFRSAVENSHEMLIIVEADGTIVYLSPAFARTLGHSTAEWVGKSVFELIHPSDRKLVREELNRIFADRDHRSFTRTRVLHANGSWRVTEAFGKAWSLGGRTLCVVNSHDVTERVLLQQEVIEVSARERERLGRDLHDGIGQQLTGLALLAKALERKLAARDAPEVAQIRELAAIAGLTLSQTRFLSKGLFPIPVGEGGLSEALEDLAESAALLFKLSVHVNIDEQIRIDDAEAAMNLYSIAREAVTNAARHGEADQITICLQAEPGGVRVSVQDDGIGIPDETERREGVGFRSMRHRARELGSELDVRLAETGGTLVQCLVPLSKLPFSQTPPSTNPDL